MSNQSTDRVALETALESHRWLFKEKLRLEAALRGIASCATCAACQGVASAALASERAKAQAEYDALPGTPADITRVADISNFKGTQPDAIQSLLLPMADALRAQGYSFFRVTAPNDDEAHVYLEAWRTRPDKQGALNRAAASAGDNRA